MITTAGNTQDILKSINEAIKEKVIKVKTGENPNEIVIQLCPSLDITLINNCGGGGSWHVNDWH